MPNVNVGSPLYMSPQAFKNRYSEKSDIWALGVSLYELLFGQVPWQAGSERELAQKMATIPVHFPGHISDECKDFIYKCLIYFNCIIFSIVDEIKRASIEELENHVWLSKQELQPIKGNGFSSMFRSNHQQHNHQHLQNNNFTTPLGDTQNKQSISLQQRESNYGKENAIIIKQSQYTLKYKSQERNLKLVNKLIKNIQVKEKMNVGMNLKKMITVYPYLLFSNIDFQLYIILAQLNFCRYLYRVCALMDKHWFVQTPCLREKLLFLVNKNIMIKINCLNEVIKGQNSLGLEKFQQYVQNPLYSKLCTAIHQYNQKYTLQFNTVWLSLQNPDQKQLLAVDKKFDAVFDDNFTEYESFYIILSSILKSAIKEIEYQLESKIAVQDTQILLPIDIEGGVILLDYLITYFQLASLIQECFENPYEFAIDSKIEQIADGKPVRLTYGHYIEIRNKIKQLDI